MSTRWSRLLIVLLIPALHPGDAAGQEVSGRVVSAADARPVAGATVTATDLSGAVAGTAITNLGGRFILRLGGPGDYLLSAARLGFATAEPVAVTVGAGSTVTVEIELREQAIELPGVTATGRRADRMDEASMEGVLARRLAYRTGATRRVVMHTDVEFRSATRISHVLRHLPSTRDCVILLKDGVPQSAGAAGIGLGSHPDDYLAIEWYRTWSDAPGTLRGVPGHILQPWNCSVIALWTK